MGSRSGNKKWASEAEKWIAHPSLPGWTGTFSGWGEAVGQVSVSLIGNLAAWLVNNP